MYIDTLNGKVFVMGKDLEQVEESFFGLWSKDDENSVCFVWDIPWRGTFRLFSAMTNDYLTVYLADWYCSAQDAGKVARDLVAFSVREAKRLQTPIKPGQDLKNFPRTVAEWAKEEVRLLKLEAE